MGRPTDGPQRKQVYSISMTPSMAETLTQMGGGSITAGFTWLINEHIRQGGFPELEQASAEFRAKISAKNAAKAAQERDRELRREAKAAARVAAQKAQEIERAARKAKRDANPSKAVLAFRETVKHFIDMNAERVGQGRTVFNLNHLRATQPDMVDAVEVDALALYGCKSGTPRCLSLEEAQKIAAERGYSPAWVAVMSGSAAEPQHAAPAPEAESLTLTPPASAPQRPGPDAETPAEVHHATDAQEPVF